jgi:hypothetical protein
MRNLLRVLAFDILAPLAAVFALVFIGIALAWPLWWVSVCSVLCLLIVQGVVVNIVFARRDSVTVGVDDDGRLNLARDLREVVESAGGLRHAVTLAPPYSR